MPRSSCSGSGGISTHPASATMAIARATKRARRITVYHSVSDSQRPPRRCASSPTTFTAAAAWIAGPNRSASHASSATSARTSSRCRKSIGPGPHGHSHIEEIGAALGMGWVMAPARHVRGHQFGNVVLSRFPINGTRAARPVVEDTAGSATCSAWTSIVSGRLLHVYNVHLGTAILERRHQARRLATIVSDRHVDRAEGRPRRLQRVDAGADHDTPQREAQERGPSRSPQAAADLPGPLSVPAPRSHLLRGRTGNRRSRAALARGSRSLRRIICRSWPMYACVFRERSQVPVVRTFRSGVSGEPKGSHYVVVKNATPTDSRDRCPR